MNDTPQLLLAHHLKALKLPTFLREYGPRTTIYNRYNRWSQKGHWQYLFAALTESLAGAPEQISIDSAHVKAHRSAGGGKGGLLYRPSAAPREAATPRSTP